MMQPFLNAHLEGEEQPHKYVLLSLVQQSDQLATSHQNEHAAWLMQHGVYIQPQPFCNDIIAFPTTSIQKLQERNGKLLQPSLTQSLPLQPTTQVQAAPVSYESPPYLQVQVNQSVGLGREGSLNHINTEQQFPIENGSGKSQVHLTIYNNVNLNNNPPNMIAEAIPISHDWGKGTVDTGCSSVGFDSPSSLVVPEAAASYDSSKGGFATCNADTIVSTPPPVSACTGGSYSFDEMFDEAMEDEFYYIVNAVLETPLANATNAQQEDDNDDFSWINESVFDADLDEAMLDALFDVK